MIRKIIMLIFTAILIAGIIGGCRAMKVYKDDMHRITRELEQYLSEQDEGKASEAAVSNGQNAASGSDRTKTNGVQSISKPNV